jgi:hypothetical protein
VAAEITIVNSDRLVGIGEVRTWVMDIIWMLGHPTNSIRASKGGQTIQMERVAAVCKLPKNREVSRINGRGWNWNAAGCAPESFTVFHTHRGRRATSNLRVWRTA